MRPSQLLRRDEAKQLCLVGEEGDFNGNIESTRKGAGAGETEGFGDVEKISSSSVVDPDRVRIGIDPDENSQDRC